jgi:hypothetical protein
MLSNFWPEIYQDTVVNSSIVVINRPLTKIGQDRNNYNLLPEKETLEADSTSLCTRNAIADLTFHNPDYVLRFIGQSSVNQFPILFTEKTVKLHSDKKAAIEPHLRAGQNIPQKLFHDDWVVGIILFAIIMFALVRATAKSFQPGIARFFLFRGTKDEGSRELIGIFQWQSTVLNLISFVVIGLFGYFAASFYNLIPLGTSGFVAWLVLLGSIIMSLTLRHFVCTVTGILSNHVEIFRDYLHTVYQSYRFGALFSFLLVVMMAYTGFLPENTYFILGSFLLLSLYLIRISRLFIIFINRNISIFYLILYLCALEILPVLVSIKYFSGLA